MSVAHCRNVCGLSVMLIPIDFAVCCRLSSVGSANASLVGYGISTENPLGVLDCASSALAFAMLNGYCGKPLRNFFKAAFDGARLEISPSGTIERMTAA